MKGWAQNDRPDAFMNADVDSVARTLASIMDEERATVVVTYDENGFYGHPDHIMANVVTRAAISMSRSPMRLYYPVAPRGVLEEFWRVPRRTACSCRRGSWTPPTRSLKTPSPPPWTCVPRQT